MINTIVKNYQSVKEAKVKIEGITILRGASNAGKSSFMKALYAGTHNRFRIGCIRYGEEACEVKVMFGESPSVLSVKRKETGSPRLTLGNPKDPDNVQRWSKLGRDLPTEVVDFLNFGTINVSNSEKYSLNFFPQFKAPLLAEFSQQKIMDILSASKSVDDLNKVRKEVDIRRTKNRGAFENMDAVLTEIKSNLAITQLRLDDMTPLESADSLVSERSRIVEKSERLAGLKELIALTEKKEREIELMLTCIELAELKEKASERLNLICSFRHDVNSVNLLEKEVSLKRLHIEEVSKREQIVNRLIVAKSLGSNLKSAGRLERDVALVRTLIESLKNKEEKTLKIISLKALLYNIKTYGHLKAYIRKGNELYNLIEDKIEIISSINDTSCYLADVQELEDLQKEVEVLNKVYKPTVRLSELKARKSNLSERRAQLGLLKSTMEQYYLVKESINSLKEIVEGNLCPLCKQPLGDHEHI